MFLPQTRRMSEYNDDASYQLYLLLDGFSRLGPPTPEVVERLLKEGADPDANIDARFAHRQHEEEDGSTDGCTGAPCVCSLSSTPLVAAAISFPDCVAPLLAGGANPCAIPYEAGDPYAMSPLDCAVQTCTTADVLRMLELGADPNFVGEYGTPLHVAAGSVEGDIPDRRAKVEALLSYGADAARIDADDCPADMADLVRGAQFRQAWERRRVGRLTKSAARR